MGRSLRRCAVLFLAIGSSLSAAPSLPAQAAPAPKTTVLLPPAPLLPEKIGAWQRTGDLDTQTLQTTQPSAKIYTEDGATRFASASYKTAGPTVKIDAIEFGDVSGAYSAFTYLAAPAGRSMIARQQGEEVELPGGVLLFRSGATLVRMSAGPGLREAAKQLRVSLPKIGGPHSQLPMAPSLLLEKGLAASTVRYALGPEGYTAMGGQLPVGILGFEKSGEIITAEYTTRSGKGLVTLLLYPTPQIAGICGRAVEAAINADRSRFGTTVRMRREGPMVVLVTGGFSTAEAQTLVEGTHLHDQLSWNKDMPVEFHAEVHKTLSLLQGIAVFCIVGCLAALVLGVFLGFGRAWVRTLMGKPAAMEQEFLRIDLRGKVEPLKPTQIPNQIDPKP